MNAMFRGLYEKQRSYGPPGGSVASLIARSKITDEQMAIVSREMPRLVGLDEKAAEEELRKLGVPLNFVEPAALGAKPKRPAREPVEESEFEKWVKTRPWYPLFREARPWYPDADEKPSPAKKAKSEK